MSGKVTCKALQINPIASEFALKGGGKARQWNINSMCLVTLVNMMSLLPLWHFGMMQ